MRERNFLIFDTPLGVLLVFMGLGGWKFVPKSHKDGNKIMIEICYVQNSLFKGFGIDFGVPGGSFWGSIFRKKCIQILFEILMIFRYLPGRPTCRVLGLPREFFTT